MRVPASRGRSQAATNVFFVLLPRLAQVRVHVHESGQEQLAPAVDHAGVFGAGEATSRVPTHARDAAALEHHVSLHVQVAARVERAHVADDE